jgi:hypothetical protein
MGAGVPTPLPPVSADAITELTRAMYKLLEEQKEMNRLLRKKYEPEPGAEFIDGHDAAAMFGRPRVNPTSKSHLRCLKHICDRYGLEPIKRKPWLFRRADVLHMAERIRREDLYVPTK